MDNILLLFSIYDEMSCHWTSSIMLLLRHCNSSEVSLSKSIMFVCVFVIFFRDLLEKDDDLFEFKLLASETANVFVTWS